MSKKSICLISFFILAAVFLPAQSPYAITAPEPVLKNSALILDSYYNMFNEVFHFSKTGPGFLFPVTLYDSEEKFSSGVYEKSNIVPTQTAVFLRYNNKKNSEVAALSTAITHPVFIRELFLQYLSYYMQDFPEWLFGGYTLLFEHANLQQNPWFETAKKLAADNSKKLTASQILSAADYEYSVDRLYPQAMLLVRFLQENAKNEYRRMLFEGILLLKQGKSPQEAFIDYADYWFGIDSFNDAFSIYVSSLKTVNELLSEAIGTYTQGDFETAANLFSKIIAVDAQNEAAFYYLGLIAYNKKNYNEAQKYYSQALAFSQNAAAVTWAMAVNAYAAEKKSDAENYALKAKNLDKTYTQKADELIQLISTFKN